MEIKNLKQLGRIGVLMGGPSTEREVSLKSGKAVLESLKSADVEVIGIDITTDSQEENFRLLKSKNIDCAFLALHGRFGEDGQIQSILDSLRIPYTGSGAGTSRLAMDKIASRKLFKKIGLNVPGDLVLTKNYDIDIFKLADEFGLPLVVKPASHGSSVGLTIVDRKEELKQAIDLAFSFDDRILIEEYIEGVESTVGILDDIVLPVVEIVPKNRFFDYEAKYKHGMTDYIVPARFQGDTILKLQDSAYKAHTVLGCYGCSRVDIILSKDNLPYVLEVNTIPGLTETSLLPKAARVAGIDFTQLCLKLIELAYEKAQVISEAIL